MFVKLILTVALLVVLQQAEVLAGEQKHIVCYHGTWATYRKGLGQYGVGDIDPFLCTHLMYAFFGIEESGDLRIIDPYLDLEDNGGRGNIRKFNALKLQNPTLKTLMAVGGWNEGSKNFSIVANDAQKRARFVQSAVSFIQRHGFDGLDLDWEYPNQRHNLTYDDENNFIALLRELRESLDPFGYMLTAAVGSAEFSASRSYNIPEVVRYVDLINVMAYDLHGPWEPVTGINAPLYAGSSDITDKDKQLNLNAIVQYWLDQGAPRDKLVVGVPFYGRSFTLADPEQHTPGSPHIGRGLAGQYSLEPGVIGYNELCERMRTEQWTLVWENEQMVPYAYQQRQWVGFETPRSIALKAQYVLDHDLAGIMVWSLESDDFRGRCGGGPYPLLHEINGKFFGGSTASGLQQLPGASFPLARPSVVIGGRDSVQSAGSEAAVNVPLSVDFHCRGKQGYVRDSQECGKFYLCNGGNTFNFVCPATLRFDLVTFSCNYPQWVDC